MRSLVVWPERFAGEENESPADDRVAIYEAVDFGLSVCFDRELLAYVPGSYPGRK